MREQRVPVMVLRKDIIEKTGNKTPRKVVLRAFIASDFQNQFNHYENKRRFSPRVPFHKDARDKYFETHYRIMINGKWYMKKAQYQMFTLNGVYEVFKKL